MKKTISIISLVIIVQTFGFSQLYMTRNGFVGFYSRTPFEDIKAENHQAYAVIDIAKKNLAFTLLIKGFIFPKELMQVHFNENYIESDKYPKASLNGTYSGDVILTKDEVFKINVSGDLTLHGVTKKIECPATLETRQGKLSGRAQFSLKPEDFNIKIPSIVRDKIEQEIKVMVQVDFNTQK
jgi:YceI-like domain